MNEENENGAIVNVLINLGNWILVVTGVMLVIILLTAISAYSQTTNTAAATAHAAHLEQMLNIVGQAVDADTTGKPLTPAELAVVKTQMDGWTKAESDRFGILIRKFAALESLEQQAFSSLAGKYSSCLSDNQGWVVWAQQNKAGSDQKLQQQQADLAREQMALAERMQKRQLMFQIWQTGQQTRPQPYYLPQPPVLH